MYQSSGPNQFCTRKILYLRYLPPSAPRQVITHMTSDFDLWEVDLDKQMRFRNVTPWTYRFKLRRDEWLNDFSLYSHSIFPLFLSLFLSIRLSVSVSLSLSLSIPIGKKYVIKTRQILWNYVIFLLVAIWYTPWSIEMNSRNSSLACMWFSADASAPKRAPCVSGWPEAYKVNHDSVFLHFGN